MLRLGFDLDLNEIMEGLLREVIPQPGIRRPELYDIKWLNRIDPDKRILSERVYLLVKRCMDVGLTVIAMPLWVPLFTLSAFLIFVESPGDPIFFIQDRTGRGGQRFRMVKFRTMVPNAEELKAQLAHLSKLQWPDFKIDNDPRVTKAGRILRATSLDELPQLLNVLKGDMSLVGPRPTFFSADRYALWQTERLDAKPGVTGLWQITARAEVQFYERARLDIIYVEKRCLWLDIQILLRTIPVVLKGEGAR